MFYGNNRSAEARHLPLEAMKPTVSSPFRESRDKTLLLISPNGISGKLAASIECEFRSLRVHMISNFGEACTSLMTNVALVVVEHEAMALLACHHEELASWHKAPVAVLVDNDRQLDASLMSLVERDIVRGIISREARLEHTLAACQILVSGGEYVPSALFRSGMAETRPAPRLEPKRKGAELTRREWQILAHVAEGRQNKIIAHELGLSEHTVKIHIHNIIRKLGAHNRTEAAAYYFEVRNSADNVSGSGPA